MYIDRDEFLAVAKVVVKYNKYLKGTDPQQLVDKMISSAYRLEGLGYMACEGYMVTKYRASDGGIGVKASISHIIF